MSELYESARLQLGQVVVRWVGGQVPRGLEVRIPGFHPGGPGSIPGAGAIPFRTFQPSFTQPWPLHCLLHASLAHLTTLHSFLIALDQVQLPQPD